MNGIPTHEHTTRRSGISRLLRVGVVVLGMIAAQAQAAVTVDNIPNIELGTWTPGMGPVSVTEEFCVRSDLFGFFPLNWQARLTDMSGASTATEYRLAEPSGASSLGFQVRLVDLRDGSFEDLVPGALTPASFRGDTANCPNGLNARLEFTFDAAGLEGAGAGIFQGRFNFFATRFGSDSDDFRVRIRVPDLVQVSDLDDIALGSFPGAGDLVGTDAVCVYRNDAAARYEVQALGQGAGNAFVLEQGASSIPFEVEFDDGAGYTGLTAGGAPLDADGADTASTSCGGGANASVRVTVREADLLSADTGAYAGTLTLTVAPI